MNKLLTTGIVIVVILIGIGGNFLLSNQNGSANKKNGKAASAKLQKKIRTQLVSNQTVMQTVSISGRVQAYNKIDVFSEVTGVLKSTAKTFRAGRYFKKDERLITIDDEVYRNTMLAEKSMLLNQLTQLIPDLMIDYPENVAKWDAFLNDFDLSKPLQPLPKTSSSRERNYIASRNIYTKYYSVKSMEAMLAKYSIKAPFNGIVTESSVNPGTLVRQNQRIGEFTSTASYELNAIADLEDLKFLKVGQTVLLSSDEINESFSGKVQRINQKISPETQSVNVFIRTSHPKLKDGMYVNAIIKYNVENAFEVQKSLLINNRSLYVVEDSIVKLKEVQVMGSYGDVAIVKGLLDGTKIITEKFEGMKEGLNVNSKVAVKEDGKESKHLSLKDSQTSKP